ncbi:MAG: S8 family serine peptidase [Candidatus Electrothrix aestuarii]|uniref:S8 family serine peptidase n=1 Tax=Candidatus Electrothrix aestuarii TaxID=3062594 RepID=A0AAU8LU21_9BACT|nr:S8 family serine peptidase [Candidatus Electrothrix aestuarii]
MSNVSYVLPVFALLIVSSSCWSQDVRGSDKQGEKLLDLAEVLKKNNMSALQNARELAKQKNWVIRAETPHGGFMELQGLTPKGVPIYYHTTNLDSADTISTDEVRSGGSLGLELDGSGMTVGQWDEAAVLSTHQELTGRVTQGDSPASISHHSTHIAGTLIASGVDADAIGMSPAAHLEAYDWNSDSAEMAAAAASGLLLSNHSYEQATGWWYLSSPMGSCSAERIWYGNNGDTEDYKFGFYDSSAQAADNIAYNAPYYLIVRSAGNNRADLSPEDGVDYCAWGTAGFETFNTTSTPRDDDCGSGGYDCISTAGTAKNILTISAVEDLLGGYPESGDPSAVVMTSFTGWGPTDDGRIKPDLVTSGMGVYSSIATSTAGYLSWSGTSMAVPGVTGSLLLLQQHYRNLHSGSFMRAATLKALAIHTADEAGPSDGPDYMFGWGLMNTKAAAKVISENGHSALIMEETYSPSIPYTLTVKASGDQPLVITTAWTDPPGTSPAIAVDPTDVMLVNDLDMTVSNGVITYYPYVLDGQNPSTPATTGDNDLDNVEQVVIDTPATGSYTITVFHEGDITGGTQEFSLIITGINPLKKQKKSLPWLMLLVK